MMQLNEEQQEAVTQIDGPLLVLAGAGSGKTRVVTHRIAHLIEQGVHPSKILGLTFTNKAAQEMKERVMLQTSHHVLISTFHSLGAKILRESIHALGYPSSFTIYDDQDTDKLIKTILQDLFPNEKKQDVRGYKSKISKAKNALLRPHEVESKDKRFPQVYRIYQEKLADYHALDFDDLLFLTVRLFQEHPEILKKYQDRWNYLLIDEYQDTNAAQYTIISLLVARTQNICVVGDPDQSIYSWRGANIRNILDFEKDYPNTKVIRLERNYRSRANILEAANALICHNDQRYEKELRSELGPGEKVKVYLALDDRDEAQYIAEKIRYHHDYHGIPLKQMVIFYRTNAQSRVFEDEFLFQRLPYVIVGGVSFYQRREIKDILAYLRLVRSDADYVSFARTINLPKRGMGDATIEKIRLAAATHEMPIITFCQEALAGKTSIKLTSRHIKGLQEYLQIIEELRQEEEPVAELIKLIIEKTGYLNHLKEDQETIDDRKSNLDALIAKAIDYDNDLDAFLEELSLKSSLDELNDSDDRINLMTIHNGKGLEFTVTFLAGLEEDLFPHVNSRESQEALEEERRLCYVGMTRAKEHLYLISCETRYIWGMLRNQRKSRFLKEIPYHLVQKEV